MRPINSLFRPLLDGINSLFRPLLDGTNSLFRPLLDGNASNPERAMKVGAYVPVFAENGLKALEGK